MENQNANQGSIKNWALDDRPREKAISKGLEILSDAELIAILIGNGTTNKSAVDLAKEILNICNRDLDILARKNIKELSILVKGIGVAKATSIAVALELGRRKNIFNAKENKKYLYSKHFAELLTPILEDKNIEEFYVIFLNNASNLICYEKISTGGTTSTIVDPKIIFKKCLENNAKRIVLAHNHPSGNKQPSEADIQITKKIYDACSYLDILLTDHIIITNNGYYSFADENKMP